MQRKEKEVAAALPLKQTKLHDLPLLLLLLFYARLKRAEKELGSLCANGLFCFSSTVECFKFNANSTHLNALKCCCWNVKRCWEHISLMIQWTNICFTIISGILFVRCGCCYCCYCFFCNLMMHRIGLMHWPNSWPYNANWTDWLRLLMGKRKKLLVAIVFGKGRKENLIMVFIVIKSNSFIHPFIHY